MFASGRIHFANSGPCYHTGRIVHRMGKSVALDDDFSFPLGLKAGNSKHRASGMSWYIEENFCQIRCMKFEKLKPKSNNSYQHVDVKSQHPAKRQKPSQVMRQCAIFLYDIIYSIILVSSTIYKAH